MSDEELVLQYSERNSNEILDEFFERYIHLVYALCMKYFRDNEKARDTAMTIFENLGPKLDTFEIHHFKSWLYTVSRNTCLMELRKKKFELLPENTEIIRMDRMEYDEVLHLDEEGSTDEKNLLAYLDKLNKNQRLCLDLMYFHKKSYREIADETGFSLKEIKSHIQNGRRNLRNFFKNEK